MGESAMLDAGQAQHLRALELANRVRLARAELKRRVAAGTLPAAEVIMDCPWEAESMSISDVLMSQKRWGRARCRRLLMSLGIPENKRIGTLTQRQRAIVAATLDVSGHTVAEVAPAQAMPTIAPARELSVA